MVVARNAFFIVKSHAVDMRKDVLVSRMVVLLPRTTTNALCVLFLEPSCYCEINVISAEFILDLYMLFLIFPIGFVGAVVERADYCLRP